MKNLILAVTLACMMTGCYHLGTPGAERFCIDKVRVENKTQESTLGRHLVSAVRERTLTDPGTVHNSGTAAYDITINVKELKNYSIARARVRDHRTADKDSDEYQTVYHRIAIYADVTVTPKDGTATILSKPYVGYGDIPRMHDRELPFQTACRQAALNLASQVLDDMATLKE